MTPRQMLGQARVHTFQYVPYLASHIYSLREQEVVGLDTAAVDEHGTLYWDPEYVMSIGVEQSAYLVAHEALHLVFDHPVRAREIIGTHPSELQRMVCNIAADLVIEQTLAVMRAIRPDGAVYLGCVVDELGGIALDFPENRSMQEYYRLIMDKLRLPPPPPQGKNDEKDQSRASHSAGGNEGGGEGQNGSQPPEGSPPEGDGSGDADSPAGSRTPDGPAAPGKGGSCGDGQPREYEVESDGSWESYASDVAARDCQQRIAQYEAEKGIGSVPGNLKEVLRAKLQPQRDPFDQLRSAVCASVACPVGGRDFTHRRRSRKQPPGDNEPLLHGRITMQPQCVIIVDTSGSMRGPDQERALSVVSQGLRKLSRVKVICADTVVRSSAVLSSASRFEWLGGGGTNMAGVLMEVDSKHRPDSIVLITDAATQWPSAPLRSRVVVAYTGTPTGHYWDRIPAAYRKVALQRSVAS